MAEIEKITKEVIQFTKKCDVKGCEKEITARTEKQLNYLMKVHKIAKHDN